MNLDDLKSADRRSLIWTLVAAEILTDRGQAGPLARLWRPVGRRPKENPEPAPKPDNRSSEG